MQWETQLSWISFQTFQGDWWLTSNVSGKDHWLAEDRFHRSQTVVAICTSLRMVYGRGRLFYFWIEKQKRNCSCLWNFVKSHLNFTILILEMTKMVFSSIFAREACTPLNCFQEGQFPLLSTLPLLALLLPQTLVPWQNQLYLRKVKKAPFLRWHQ